MSLQGIGLRAVHYDALLETPLDATCAEIVTENLLGRGGRPLAVVERVRAEMPVYLHGVSLSIGGVDPLAVDYLRTVRDLADRIDAPLVSDHLCFGTFGGHFGHDLWPLPFTEEALEHVVERVCRAQDILGRRLLLENVSSYVAFAESSLREWEFLTEVCLRADSLVLLDVNNVVVNAFNHGFSPSAFIEGIPVGRVAQLHLAGHADRGTHLFDDHSSAVSEEVWALYRAVLVRFGAVPAIVEWDGDIPALDVVLDQSRRARREIVATLQEAAA